MSTSNVPAEDSRPQEAVLNNLLGKVDVRFGGEIYKLDKGRTRLSEWEEVPPRLRRDVAQQAVRQYGAYRPTPDSPERPGVVLEWVRVDQEPSVNKQDIPTG